MGATAPAALKNNCPACGALQGNRCVDEDGIIDAIHPARVEHKLRFHAHESVEKFVDRVIHLRRS